MEVNFPIRLLRNHLPALGKPLLYPLGNGRPVTTSMPAIRIDVVKANTLPITRRDGRDIALALYKLAKMIYAVI